MAGLKILLSNAIMSDYLFILLFGIIILIVLIIISHLKKSKCFHNNIFIINKIQDLKQEKIVGAPAPNTKLEQMQDSSTILEKEELKTPQKEELKTSQKEELKTPQKEQDILSQKTTEKEDEEITSKLLDPVDGKCTDPNFPYLDKSNNKCVQCFPNSWNCLTGFQRCHLGICVRKNSPQCAYYPFGAQGWSFKNTPTTNT